MPVGFGKSYWHHQISCLVMDLGKSRFIEPDLGNFMIALSRAAGQDTPILHLKTTSTCFSSVSRP